MYPVIKTQTYYTLYSDEKLLEPQYLHVWQLCSASLIWLLFGTGIHSGAAFSKDEEKVMENAAVRLDKEF